jgi:hypothetical protein
LAGGSELNMTISAGPVRTLGTIIIACISVLAGCSQRNSAAPRSIRGSDSSVENIKSGRRVYAYSLVAGGVASEAEFALARATDPVLKTHYRDVGPHVTLQSLSRDERMYASYRIGNKIYWTRHTVVVHRGETVLTDGQHLIRTRCGNRLSSAAREPTRFIEPPDVSSDRPLPARLIVDLPPSVPGSGFDPIRIPVELPDPESRPDRSESSEPILPVRPADTSWPSPVLTAAPVIAPNFQPRLFVNDPPVLLPTPEPGTWLLIASGLGLIGIRVRRAQKH